LDVVAACGAAVGASAVVAAWAATAACVAIGADAVAATAIAVAAAGGGRVLARKWSFFFSTQS
jgi:galactitol-specific phosphotransferase system IIB component